MRKSALLELSSYCEAFLQVLYPSFCIHCQSPLEKSNLIFCPSCIESVEYKNKRLCCPICYRPLQNGFCCPPKLLSLTSCCFEKQGPFETLVKLAKSPLGMERYGKLIASFLLVEMEKSGALFEDLLLIPFDSTTKGRFFEKKGSDVYLCNELKFLNPRFSLVCPVYKNLSNELFFFKKSVGIAQGKTAAIISLEHPKKDLLKKVLGKLLCLPWKELHLFSFCSK